MARPETMDTTFASSSVPRHVMRGLLGLALLMAAFGLLGAVGPWSLVLLGGTVALWRGCPTCWLLGLVQTREITRCSTEGC